MCVSSRFQVTVVSPPVNHCCGAHSDHLLPFPPASASQTWTQEAVAHLHAPGALVTGLRLVPLSGLVQMGLGWSVGALGQTVPHPPARREPSPPARTPPFHPRLRTKPSPQCLTQAEGASGTSPGQQTPQAHPQVRPQSSQPSVPAPHGPRGQTQHNHFTSGCCSAELQDTRASKRMIMVLFSYLRSTDLS